MNKPGGLGRGLQALLSQQTGDGDKKTTASDDDNQQQVINSPPKVRFVDNKQAKTLKTKPIDKKSSNTITADSSDTLNNARLETLPITQLKPGKYQPRNTMEPEALKELADSIKQQGLLQPLVVRKIEQLRYEIIAGERRWRASKLAGLTQIPVILTDVDDEKAIIMALIENLQREDLNIMEEARAMERLINEFNLTHQKVANLLCKSRTAVTNCLRLLHLNKDVRFLLESGEIDMGHARALLILEGKEQSEVARQIVTKGLTVREAEALITRTKEGSIKNTTIKKDYISKAYEQQLNQLSNVLNTNIILKSNKNGKGKIVIHYDDAIMLEKMLKQLTS